MMVRRPKILLASLVLAVAVLGIVPAIAAAASPRDALSNKTRNIIELRSLGSMAAAVVSDDDIPGVTIPASPFSDTLQWSDPGPDPYNPLYSDQYDVYQVSLTAGQAFYVEMSGAANTDFDMWLFRPGTPSLNYATFDDLAAYSWNADSDEAIMYTAEMTGTYYLVLEDYSYPTLSAPASYTVSYGFPTKQPAVSAGFLSRSVAYGASTSVTGTVSFEGAPLADTTVVLLSKPYYADEWSYAREMTTTAEGAYNFTLKPSSKTAYWVIALGDFEYLDAVTTPTWVTPKAWVGNAAAPSTMYVNRAASVWAFLKPRHTAGTYPVRIYKDRYVNGAWKSYGYVTAKAANYSNYTKVTGAVKLPYAGRWRLRAYHSDSGHAATYSSGYDYVTVK